jgi:hypothetical protein
LQLNSLWQHWHFVARDILVLSICIFYRVWQGVVKFFSFAPGLGIFFARVFILKISPLHFGPGLLGGFIIFGLS